MSNVRDVCRITLIQLDAIVPAPPGKTSWRFQIPDIACDYRRTLWNFLANIKYDKWPCLLYKDNVRSRSSYELRELYKRFQCVSV